MKVIGLCGGSGSGKSTISACLAKRGAEVIDADKIARSLTENGSPVLDTIRTTFGDKVFHQDGTLNRGALAKIVFSDSEALKQLNAITHPEIAKQIQQRLKDCKTTAVIDAAVLHQAGLELLCDKTIFITAPKDIRLERIMKRDGISEEAAEARINAQPTDAEYETITDFTVCNDGKKTIHEIAEYILQGVM
ncbi:MAG: dephospho-CoA kinase [Ruminococcaceae bacterium]|nr:dephospho-CoA kinase [Oscillospiraceae bacterium]